MPPYPPYTTPAQPAHRGRIGLALALVAVVFAAFVGVAVGRGLSPRTSGSAAGATFVPSTGFPFDGGASSAGSSSGANSAATDGVAAKVTPGVVDITTRLGYADEAAAGTGMVLTSNGEVLTNNHVVDGATTIAVQIPSSGQTYRAKIVGTDPTDDVAVIQLDGASGLKTIPIGDSSKVAGGDSVVAIGNAGGVGGAPSVVTGTVEAVNQSITASDQDGENTEQLSGLIETNAPLEPGDSGGPLANTAGQVIGMDTAASTGTRFEASSNVGFAIPIATALSIARQIEGGKGGGNIQIGSPGFLGVLVQSATDEGSNSPTDGAAVAAVVPDSPAASVGLTAGDIITAVDGQQVTSATALTAAMHLRHPGDSVTITWTDTDGQSHTKTATLTTGPAD
jgi:S1-C subfamily serine protease